MSSVRPGSERLRIWALLVAVQIMWALQYPAYSIVARSLSSATLSFWTFVFALCALLPVLLFTGQEPRLPRRRHLGSDSLRFLLLAAFGYLPSSILLSWGIAHSSASNGAILMLATPALMVLLGMLMFREKPGPLLAASLLSALVGSVVISWKDIVAGSYGRAALLGNAAILSSALGTAFFNGYSKKLLERYSPVETLVYGCIAAALQCAVISLLTDTEPFYRISTWSATTWAGLAILGLVAWGLGTLLWVYLLDRLELIQISVSVYLLPLFGVLVSALTLQEHITVWQLAGGAIVLLSTHLSMRSTQPRAASAA